MKPDFLSRSDGSIWAELRVGLESTILNTYFGGDMEYSELRTATCLVGG